MMIGPSKRKQARRAAQARAAAAERLAAAAANSPRRLTPLPDDDPLPPAVAPTPVEEDPTGPEAMLARLDGLHARIAGLLTLVDAIAGVAPARPPVPPAAPVVASDTMRFVATPVAPAADRAARDAPHRPATFAPPTPRIVPLSVSAVLVARELLARGVHRRTVEAQLRDGYGVAEPDAVIAAASRA